MWRQCDVVCEIDCAMCGFRLSADCDVAPHLPESRGSLPACTGSLPPTAYLPKQPACRRDPPAGPKLPRCKEHPPFGLVPTAQVNTRFYPANLLMSLLMFC